MAGVARRLPPLLIALLVLATPLATSVGASVTRDAHDEEEVSVTPRDGGVDVAMSYVVVGGEIRLRPGHSAPTGEDGCVMTVERIPPLEALPLAEDWFEGAVDVRITCGPGGRNQDTWVAIPDADATATDLAADYAERVLAPDTTIGTSPPANILVGLSTWFWLDGWDTTTHTTTVTAPWGDTLDLELTLEEITWDFGDGTPTHTGGTGQAYPAQSDIQHVYTHRSTSRQHPDATYPLNAELTIAVTYTYDTFGPVTTDPIELAIDHPITVHQLQAVITR